MLTAIPAEVTVNQKAAALPIWITVRVPKDAASGEYRGELAVSADGLKPTACPCPVTLNVAGWTMPEPKDFRTYNGMCQSPERPAPMSWPTRLG